MQLKKNPEDAAIPMASKNPLEESATLYRERIEQFSNCDITPWPGQETLRKFMKKGYSHSFAPEYPKLKQKRIKVCNAPAEISIINIPGEGDASVMHMEGAGELSKRLPSLAENSSSQLIIVENICPETLALLGGFYDIDIQFFAEYTNVVVSWYQMYETVPERLPALPSTRIAEDFLSLKYVSTRQFSDDGSSILESSVIWPDMEETRIGNSAGRLKPISAPKKTFPPMAFTRQCLNVWCKKKIDCQGWVAIMLVDKPFPLESKYGSLGKAEFRNPNLRPKVNEAFDGDEIRESFKKAFCSFLLQRCTTDKMYLKTCATNPFLTLYEGYRIIASEWLVVNEYVKRQLTNIERHLEKKDLKESTFQELEEHLKELYRIRRRCNKDHELVDEAASQCEKRGQYLWPSSNRTSDGNPGAFKFAEQHAQNLEKDFKYVLSNMETTISRIEKDINLLVALVAISEGSQSLQENRGISFLTLVATIFLPCTAVASVLGIQTQYAPGARYFWILWAIALPITILVITIFFLYPTVSSTLNQFWAKYIPVREESAEDPEEEEDEEEVEKKIGVWIEGIKPYQHPICQTWSGSMV